MVSQVDFINPAGILSNLISWLQFQRSRIENLITLASWTLLTFLTTHANLPPYPPYVLYLPACFMPVCLCSCNCFLFLFSWLYHTWDLSSPGIELVPCPLHWECGVATTAIFFLTPKFEISSSFSLHQSYLENFKILLFLWHVTRMQSFLQSIPWWCGHR